MFIVLEGADGSGKSTQFRLTVERLKAVGHDVEVFKFPQYDQLSSSFVKAYLNGEYGPASEVSPYTASMFYALDRYHAAPRIKQALASGKVVVADRYVGSNMAHQGSKFTNFAQQRGFFIWEDSLEFELLGIPRPNINIYLRVPVEISLGLMGDRSDRSYTNKKLDEHEGDQKHLEKTIAAYDLLCKLFPKDFKEIDCAPKDRLLGIVEINNAIWQLIKPLLPEPKGQPKSSILKLDVKKAPSKINSKNRQTPASIRSILKSKTKRTEPKDFDGRPLKLVSALPHNELDLLCKKIESQQLDTWNFSRKQAEFLREINILLTDAKYEFETDRPGQLLSLNAQQLLHVKLKGGQLYSQVIDMVSEVHPQIANFVKNTPHKSFPKAVKRPKKT